MSETDREGREGREVGFHVGAFVTLFVFFPLLLPSTFDGRVPSRRFVGTSNALRLAHLPSLGGRAELTPTPREG